MADPLTGAATDIGTGALLGLGTRIYRRLSFPWRIAAGARKAAKAQGYFVSRRRLWLVVRAKPVKTAIRSGQAGQMQAAFTLLEKARPVNRNGVAMPAEELFRLLRRSYFGAAEPAEREITLHDEVIKGVQALATSGDARAALWRTYVDQLSPSFGQDAVAIRESVGDSMDRVLRELLRAADRAALLRSWATSPPSWLPDQAGLLGWLGEYSSEVEARDAALAWFTRAIEQGAVPIAYWKVRWTWANPDLDEAATIDYLEDVTEDPIAKAVLPGDPEERLGHARSWTPQSAVQDSIRSTLIADFMLSRLQLDELIEFGTTAFDTNGHTGAGGLAVEAYLRRSGMDMRGAHTLDLSAGLALALKIRDARRRWGLSSGGALSRERCAPTQCSRTTKAHGISRTRRLRPRRRQTTLRCAVSPQCCSRCSEMSAPLASSLM